MLSRCNKRKNSVNKNCARDNLIGMNAEKKVQKYTFENTLDALSPMIVIENADSFYKRVCMHVRWSKMNFLVCKSLTSLC
jgi:hypothetical protein